jgi:hypothetical protein
MPVSKPNCFSYDISQYGQIIHEDRNKLIMRLPAEGFDVLSHIRQIWVSKYLAPSTECTISFSLPASSGRNKNATLVIIQRVVPKTDDNTAAPSTSDATKKNSTSTIPAPKTTSGAHHTPSTVDGNGNKVALPAPVFGGRNSTLVATQRVCATDQTKMPNFLNE